MIVHKDLLSKNGAATLKLSKEFLKYQIGDRIPTITEFSKDIDLARGTIQNALKNLINSGAITLESKGHLGTFITKKNNKKLLEYAGINSLVGTLPLPYSKRYEGLANGLIATSENTYLPINLAYVRGAINRIDMVVKGRYDFALVSKFAAENYLKENDDIKILINFGKYSFTSKHVLMFHDKKDKEIKDGMSIAIDKDSLDQCVLTKQLTKKKKVNFINIEYSRIVDRILSGDIDCAVMNIDEVIEKGYKINYHEINNYNTDSTEAVIIISKARVELESILKEIIKVDEVLKIQNDVLSNKIIPSY